MSVPAWIQDAIFYQIFPDRFFNGELDNDPPNLQPWGLPPTTWGFQGGDLSGIIKKFDYLLDLGINALYLNPIFQATSNHRYNTTDYYQIDNKLGTLADFHALIKLAHRNDIRVILDGVFNHCGRGFFAFNDVLENQEHSPYADWYHIKSFPVNAYSGGSSTEYLGWWGMKGLPKFNTNNQKLRNYLYDVGCYWIEQGADGWRLDVPNEIDDDSFWAEFRQKIKSVNSEAYLVGEIWTPELRWVGEQHFDGLMNYPLMEALSGWLVHNTLDAAQFGQKMEALISFYPHENTYAMYLPVGSHDTERLLTKMGNDLDKTRLAYLYQFAYPGAPAIYYGDEIGLTGGKDPGCRGAFIWDEAEWKNDLREFIKKLVALRKRHAALRRGDYLTLPGVTNPSCYAFARALPDEKIVIALNSSSKEQSLTIPAEILGWEEGQHVKDLINPGKRYNVSNHHLEISLPAVSGCWLT